MQKIIVFIGIIGLFSCGKKQDVEVNFSGGMDAVTEHTINVSYSFSYDDGDLDEVGVIWAYKTGQTLRDYHESYYEYVLDSLFIWTANEATTSFNYQLTSLKEYTNYFIKPFAIINGKAFYGEEVVVQTLFPSAVEQGPAGGYVIYDDGAGGGLEVALYDIGEFESGSRWGCEGMNVPGTVDDLGAGQANTTAILTYCTSNETGAYSCANYEQNGFSDWYLPSLLELQLMYTELAAKGYGNFKEDIYLSSTQASLYDGKVINFIDGQQFNNSKWLTIPVRAIRSF